MFNLSFTEKEILSLIEVINRAYKINYPPLMYYQTLLKLEEKIRIEVEKQIDFNILNN